jgi:hypothetical protein
MSQAAAAQRHARQEAASAFGQQKVDQIRPFSTLVRPVPPCWWKYDPGNTDCGTRQVRAPLDFYIL